MEFLLTKTAEGRLGWLQQLEHRIYLLQSGCCRECVSPLHASRDPLVRAAVAAASAEHSPRDWTPTGPSLPAAIPVAHLPTHSAVASAPVLRPPVLDSCARQETREREERQKGSIAHILLLSLVCRAAASLVPSEPSPTARGTTSISQRLDFPPDPPALAVTSAADEVASTSLRYPRPYPGHSLDHGRSARSFHSAPCGSRVPPWSAVGEAASVGVSGDGG